MKSLLIQTFCLLFLCLGTVRAQQYQLASPNGKLSVTVDAGEALTWQIAHDGTTVLQPSAIALQGRDEKSAKKAITFGKNVKVIRYGRCRRSPHLADSTRRNHGAATLCHRPARQR